MIDKETKKMIIRDILQGKSPIDIVIEYELSPDEVEKIYKEIYTQKEKSILNFDIPDDILALFILASIITVLDIITTRIALLHPLIYEVNPIMSSLINLIGIKYALLLNASLSMIGIIVLTLLSVKYLHGYSRYFPLLLYSTLRLIPVISNYKILLNLFS